MKNLIFFLSATIAVSFYSCKKEEPVQPPPTVNNTPIGDFFAKNGVSAQTFTINSAIYQTVNGVGGTKIYIYPNSFVTQSNQPVTGNVTITLREISSKKDMILSKAPTTSGGKPLISGGEIYLSATQNNQKLKLATTGTVYAEIPAGLNPSSQMNEFYASKLDASADWKSVDTTKAIPVFQDSSTNKNYYSFQVDSMNWINCDYFYKATGPTSNILVTVGNNFDTSNCYVFISFNGQNSAAHCYAYTNHIFSPGSYYTLPIGLNVTFVAIAKKDGQYYSTFKSSVITSNHNEILNLSTTTESQIKQSLAVLP